MDFPRCGHFECQKTFGAVDDLKIPLTKQVYKELIIFYCKKVKFLANLDFLFVNYKDSIVMSIAKQLLNL